MSARDEAVKLAVYYLVTINQNVTSSDSYTEVESMVDLIIEALADAAAELLKQAVKKAPELQKASAQDLGTARAHWLSTSNAYVPGNSSLLGQFEQAFEAGWAAREEHGGRTSD